jgi:transposase-like protein
VNTVDDDSGRRRRRKHSDEFKTKVVAACRKQGVSIAAVALAHRLNANLLRRWVVAAERDRAAKPARSVVPSRGLPVPAAEPTFIPVPIVKSASESQITIELRRGPTAVKVAWPVTAAAECAAWLRELLR